jgi:hypothetical protein
MSVADKVDFEEGSGRVVMENCSTTIFLEKNKNLNGFFLSKKSLLVRLFLLKSSSIWKNEIPTAARCSQIYSIYVLSRNSSSILNFISSIVFKRNFLTHFEFYYYFYIIIIFKPSILNFQFEIFYDVKT